MKNSIHTGAALRLRHSAGEPADIVSTAMLPAIAPPQRRAPRENLYPFPMIGTTKTGSVAVVVSGGRTVVAAEPSLSRLETLAGELEAALMSDLKKAVPARETDLARPAAGKSAPSTLPLAQAELEHGLAVTPSTSLSKADVPEHDRLAVELLLARGRRRQLGAAPARPTPRALETQLAGELAQRLSDAVDGLKLADGEPVAFNRETDSFAAPRERAMFNRPLVALAAAIALVGGGAVLTVQSLTAGPEAPIASDLDGVSTAGIAPPAEAGELAQLPHATKLTYDRADSSQSLPEASPLSAAAGSAGGTQVVQPSVRAAYAVPVSSPTPEAAIAVAAPEAAPEAVASVESEAATPAPQPSEPVAQDVTDKGATSKGEAAAPEAVVATAPAADELARSTARITSGVRLRGNPDNDAPVLALLRPGTSVEIINCKGWCEVVADGKRGFVYKRFLGSS